MKVEVQPDGKHVISDADDRIELTQVSYEDIFYAIPIDNGSLFMLLNDTVLESAEQRAALKRIVDRKGGIETAMKELQDLVKEVQPGGAAPPPPPSPPEPEEEEERTIVLPDLKKTSAPSRFAEPESEEEEKTIVLPPIKVKHPTPAPAPTPKTPLPAKPTHPTPAKPAAVTPAKGVPPVTPTHPTPARPAAPAKPAHPTPAASKPPLPSALPPMAPLKKTEHPKPAAALPPMEPLKKTEHQQPAAAAAPAKAPAAGAPSIGFTSFDPTGKPALKVAKLGADLFVIGWGDMVVSLNRTKYERLHGMCPAPTSTLFHTLMSEVLVGDSKATFRKIVAQAGHSKPILDAINEQVEKLHPGAAVKKG